MYWYKPSLKYSSFTGVLMLICFMYACKPEIKETGAELKYFDIKEYFNNQDTLLKRLNRPVYKSVTHNGATESKKLLIENWTRELSSFTESDINKPAWKASYTVDSSATRITYKAKFPDLKTREIVIKKENGKVSSIVISNIINNLLYTTTEKLSYIPGSYYQIEKTQKVKIMGANSYRIKGVFN
jgi:hypothetical protein